MKYYNWGNPHTSAGVKKLVNEKPNCADGYMITYVVLLALKNAPNSSISVGGNASKPKGKVIGAGPPVKGLVKYDGGQGLRP